MKHLIRSVSFVGRLALFVVLASCGSGQPTATPTYFSPLPKPTRSPPIDILTPSTSMPDPVLVAEDIFYTDKLMLNVYVPREANHWPVIVVLHGSSMTKDGLISGFSQAIAERGALVFTPTWRSSLSTEAEHVTHGLEDAARALRFAREKAPE